MHRHPTSPSRRQVVDRFLAAKAKLDGAGSAAGMDDVMDALHALGTLRALLCARLASGLRDDVPDDVLATRQKWAGLFLCRG